MTIVPLDDKDNEPTIVLRRRKTGHGIKWEGLAMQVIWISSPSSQPKSTFRTHMDLSTTFKSTSIISLHNPIFQANSDLNFTVQSLASIDVDTPILSMKPPNHLLVSSQMSSPAAVIPGFPLAAPFVFSLIHLFAAFTSIQYISIL